MHSFPFSELFLSLAVFPLCFLSPMVFVAHVLGHPNIHDIRHRFMIPIFLLYIDSSHNSWKDTGSMSIAAVGAGAAAAAAAAAAAPHQIVMVAVVEILLLLLLGT